MRDFTQRGLLRWAGALPVLLAAFALGQEEGGRLEQWLAKRADTAAWEELSVKWDEVSASATMPVENLVLPLATNANGRVSALLRAEKAQIIGEDLIFARNVKVDMFLPDGSLDGTLVAEDCLVSRATKRGYCRGAVDVKKGTDHLKGRGMFFSTDDKFIKLLSECEIRTFRIPTKLGRLS